jgi:putative NADH-flavin reductase
MRILIAGATGAIGRPLVRRLRANQHAVFALTRSPNFAPALKEIDAEAIAADALDAAAVKAAVGRIRPDAVINELTSLPRHYTPSEMKAAAERDRKVRVEGNINLLPVLRDSGVRRYLLQSSGFWHAACASSLVRMHHLAFSHSQVMQLVMRPAHHDADEAQAAKTLHLLRVARCDGQHNAIRQWLSLGAPTVQMRLVDLLCVCRDHALYGSNRPALSCNGSFDAAV